MGTKPEIPAPADLGRVKRYPYKKRLNKVNLDLLGKPYARAGIDGFLESLPKTLRAAELVEYIDLVVAARRKNRPFQLLMGAHVIKVGLTPIIIDLMKRGIATGVSFNGAGVIHELELAFFGGTSEDVLDGLKDGSFGMVEETGQMFAAVCELASAEGIGLGQATGRFINHQKARCRNVSIFAIADKLGLPATVHVSIGTDIVAQHPEYDAALAGEASHHDFRVLATICSDIDRGGAVANIGSAVLLPEVFLKALTVARNLKRGMSALTTANFDMISHYRPTVNIVRRPTDGAGKGFNFVGHHEIMIPLLAWGLKTKYKN